MSVKFELLEGGYCTASRSHALSGVKRETIRFYATFAYLFHPVQGHILFDTGYTRRFYSETKKWPFSIYARMTPVFIDESKEAQSILQAKGIDPADIKTVILSHFHADHIGGLKDFPNAKIVCSKIAYEAVKFRKGFAAVRKGFIPNLLPHDFENRLEMIDMDSANMHENHLGKSHDLFADGSIRLFKLDGHAHGQIGALVKTDKNVVFLVADGAWLRENYQSMHLPNQIVRLFFDSWKDYKDSLKRIHDFHKSNPDVKIIPCHCEKTLEEIRMETL